MLKATLLDRGVVESISDPCVHITKNLIVFVAFAQSLHNGPENFVFTEEGTLESHLGVCITNLPRSEGFEMSQPFLIDRIIKVIGFELATTKGAMDNVPATYPLLNKDVDGPARKTKWKYRDLIGMLGCLQGQGTNCPDISMAAHQCARFSTDFKFSHERAVKKIVRYQLDTNDKGIIFRPGFSRGLECFVDADFAGGWKDSDHSSPASVLSRTGFVIMFAGCPII